MATPERLRRNKTGDKTYVRPDMAGKMNEMMGDSFDCASNDAYKGSSGRGSMPKDQYPGCRVKTKCWNDHRPMMRDVRTTVHKNRDHRSMTA